MTVIYTPHTCETPPAYVPWYARKPEHLNGTIWRCDGCGRYWRFRVPWDFADVNSKWRLVQPWHLLTVFRILRIEAKGPAWRMGPSGHPELTY